MKRKMRIFIILLLIIIIMITAGIIIFTKVNNENKSNKNNMAISENKVIDSNLENFDNNVSDDATEVNNIQNEISLNNRVINSSLPSDEGLTVNDVPKTYNQDIMSKANIAYLLGCENITEETDFEKYINEHMPNNGIYISEVSVYEKTDNPYDFLKPRKDIMLDNLKAINMNYKIDNNNYLLDNKSKDNLSKKLNKVINGDKKIIIGFDAEYYVYINDIEDSLSKGGYRNSSYVSFKPYNNVYAFIFDENSADIDDFYQMIEEVSSLAD